MAECFDEGPRLTVGLNEGGRPSKTGVSETPVLAQVVMAPLAEHSRKPEEIRKAHRTARSGLTVRTPSGRGLDSVGNEIRGVGEVV